MSASDAQTTTLSVNKIKDRKVLLGMVTGIPYERPVKPPVTRLLVGLGVARQKQAMTRLIELGRGAKCISEFVDFGAESPECCHHTVGCLVGLYPKAPAAVKRGLLLALNSDDARARLLGCNVVTQIVAKLGGDNSLAILWKLQWMSSEEPINEHAYDTRRAAQEALKSYAATGRSIRKPAKAAVPAV